jgi:hypothetical protein
MTREGRCGYRHPRRAKGQLPLDHHWMEEPAQLKALEALFDPTTTAVFESTGIASGWRCLEVGGGAGSVTR